MATLQQLLDQKGREVLTVSPEASVLEAIRKMAEENVGSLVVMEDGRLAGIITERHYARNVYLKGRSSPETTVGEIMSSRCVCARPVIPAPDQAQAQACLLKNQRIVTVPVMTDKAVRHLPVLDRKQVIGIVSIGDLVKSIISDQKFRIEQLEHYITH